MLFIVLSIIPLLPSQSDMDSIHHLSEWKSKKAHLLGFHKNPNQNPDISSPSIRDRL